MEDIPDMDIDFVESDSDAGILVPSQPEEAPVELEIPSLDIPELSIEPAPAAPKPPPEDGIDIPSCPENLATVLVELDQEDPNLSVINKVLDTERIRFHITPQV